MRSGLLLLGKSVMTGIGIINAVVIGLLLHEGRSIPITMFGFMAVTFVVYYMLAKAQRVTEQNNHSECEVGA